jgi:CRISPR-associated protein Cas5t
VTIDVLNDVRLVIYLSHENENYLAEILSTLKNPIHRLDVLHLGRAEDWITYEGEPELFDISDCSPIRRDADYHHFFWIPEKMWYVDDGDRASSGFESFDGLLYNLPTFSTVQNFDKTFNRNDIRSFSYVKAKLNDGLLRNRHFLFDNRSNLPFFLAEL